MRELPILFKGEMVRAILDWRKTQTRRIIKPQPDAQLSKLEKSELWTFSCCDREWKPKYQLGDRLWVRETWKRVEIDDEIGTRTYPVTYKSDGPPYQGGDCFWKSPLFMPKKYARIWLEVTAVRVERVKDIPLRECHKEGYSHKLYYHMGFSDSKKWFQDLWNQIYKSKPEFQWDKNPWVWVYEFKKEP